MTTDPKLSPEEMQQLDAGSIHPYSCTCIVCLRWWHLVGPEYDDDDTPIGYGPFGKTLPPLPEVKP